MEEEDSLPRAQCHHIAARSRNPQEAPVVTFCPRKLAGNAGSISAAWQGVRLVSVTGQDAPVRCARSWGNRRLLPLLRPTAAPAVATIVRNRADEWLSRVPVPNQDQNTRLGCWLQSGYSGLACRVGPVRLWAAQKTGHRYVLDVTVVSELDDRPEARRCCRYLDIKPHLLLCPACYRKRHRSGRDRQ
jgi:hypothetical protein